MDQSMIIELLKSHSNIVVAVIVFNTAIGALQKILEVIQDKTSTKVDNKAYIVVSKISSGLSTLTDLITGNREHK